MKLSEIFGLVIVCVLIYFLFKEVVHTFDEVEVETTPNGGVKFKASRRDALAPLDAPPLILEGN